MASAEDPKIIAVLGSTRTGKSSFIRLVTAGDHPTDWGRNAEPYTSEIGYTEYMDANFGQLTFMDTPAFDDSTEGMSEILQRIGSDLHQEYGEGKRLSGVIYMYNIATTVSGINLRNIRILERLVAHDCLKNVVIITTMWDTVHRRRGERREAELRSNENLFKLMIDAGAQMIRHDSGLESARKIVKAVLRVQPPMTSEDTERVAAMIAVLGATGTGKSSFIRLVTGDDTVCIGHSLQSDTSEIVYTSSVNDDNRQLTFMDTPGFNDSEGLSDIDILRMIGNDLYHAYGENKLLHGVIYMYNIANTRVGGMNLRNIRLLEKLVGPKCLMNVVLVTTMWETVRLSDGERREAELRSNDKLFKPFIDAGAQMIRHDSGQKSARRIIEAVLKNEPKPLLVQTELMEGAVLGQTSAGKELVIELDRGDGFDTRGLKLFEEALQNAEDAGDRVLVRSIGKEMAELKRRMQSRAENRKKLAKDRFVPNLFGLRMHT
ncbi:G domain-containing protein [Mycena sanguinolenta]|uniref:G domain-containing protein n=1 Tax=Mycena sanguinolenta TaxID=230812 RepID=A0A8H6XAW0_9AGAR|nr:G domain-containing protein [Mycena sanguinolenta]